MNIRSSINELPHFEEAYITIGNFDGLHIGHRKILSALKTDAGKKIKIAVSFKKAPIETLNPTHFPGYLFPEGMKEHELKKEGFDELVQLDFPEIAHLTAHEFLNELKSRVAKLHLYVGYNFRFGKDNSGDTHFLKSEAVKTGFELTVVERVNLGLETVSSSLIRKKIAEGHIDKALEMLGKPFFYRSIQVQGDQIGRTIGYPTINLKQNRQLLPDFGVYFTFICADGKILPAMTYIGKRPTVDGIELRNETNILADAKDLPETGPGKVFGLFFISKIRIEKRFHNLEELKENLYNDKCTVLGLLEHYPVSRLEEWNNCYL